MGLLVPGADGKQPAPPGWCVLVLCLLAAGGDIIGVGLWSPWSMVVVPLGPVLTLVLCLSFRCPAVSCPPTEGPACLSQPVLPAMASTPQ